MPIINPGTGGGSPGPQGPQGIQGFPGFGFDGIDGEDSLSIPGSQGATGSQGVPGINGSQGIPGEDGLSGEDSFIPGPPGIQGIQGTNGTIGRDGARGLDGEDGLSSDDLWPGFNPFRDDPLEQISRIQDQNLAIFPNYSVIVTGPYTINSGNQLTIGPKGKLKIVEGANRNPPTEGSLFVPSNPTGTTSATSVMMGLGKSPSLVSILPIRTGRIYISANGNIENESATTGLKCVVGLRIGTGGIANFAPANGAAAQGSVLGNPQTFFFASAENSPKTSFCLSGMALLSVGRTYWVDLTLNSTVGDLISVSNLSVTVFEF